MEKQEFQEAVQALLDMTLKWAKEQGFGVVGDGTVHGDGVWIDRLRVRPMGPPDPEESGA